MAREFSTDLYDRDGARELMRRLSSEVLLSQGPMGTMLQSQPMGEDVPPAAWNVSEPQLVERVHALYAAVGCQVFITNTFQASAPALKRDGVRQGVAEVNRAAVDCARRAGAKLLLGSIGPCGDSYLLEDSPEYRALREAYRDQAHALLSAGVEGLILETFTSIRDLAPALAGARDAADDMPVMVSFALDAEGDLLGDGLNIEAAGMYARSQGARVVGINCCEVGAATAALHRLAIAVPGTPLAVRPSAGVPHRGDDGSLAWHERPEAFVDALASWIHDGAHLVGGCCGTTPLTACALASALDA